MIQVQCTRCGDVDELAQEALDDIRAAKAEFICWDCVTQIYDELG